MEALVLVRPMLQIDVKRLEINFIHGYQKEDKFFYISSSNDNKEVKYENVEICQIWSKIWKNDDEEYE